MVAGGRSLVLRNDGRRRHGGSNERSVEVEVDPGRKELRSQLRVGWSFRAGHVAELQGRIGESGRWPEIVALLLARPACAGAHVLDNTWQISVHRGIRLQK